MALFRDDQGKTEKATPRKLSEARDKGQTNMSKELVMAGTLLVAFLCLELMGPWFIDRIEGLFQHAFNVDLRDHHLDEGSVHGAARELGIAAEHVLPPFLVFLAVVVLATLVFGYGQIGVKLSPKAMEFKAEKLNPVSNLSKLFRFSQVFKAILSLAKLAVLGGVLYLVIKTEMGSITGMLDHGELSYSLAMIARLAFRVFFWISLIVFVLSIGDYAWQRYDFAEQMKMTKQEVEDERKRDDGDPMVKSRLKGARMKLMKQRMMDAVPEADVVITNPTHFSVAIRYDRAVHAAPEVTAKGIDAMALRIRELAGENDVPMMEDPPLARALYRAVDVGQQIPEKFYQAVATVLGHVYRLDGRVA